MAGQKAAARLRSAGKQPDLSSQTKRESRNILTAGLGGHQNFLIDKMRRRGSLGNKGQLQVVDDPVYHAVVGEERDDLHLSAAARAGHRVNFIDFTDHLGPAFGGDGPELLLHHPDRKKPKACLPDLPSMGVGVQPIISHRDLALVRDMGSRPGYELLVRRSRAA